MAAPTQYQRPAEEALAIRDLVVRYGFLLDDRDWHGFGQVFTHDAIVDFRDHSVQPPAGLSPISGRDEIVRQFRDVLTHPYQHMLVSVVLDDVSPDEVIARSKALFPTPGLVVSDVVYRDVVVRTGSGWQIKHKSIKRYSSETPPWSQEQFAVWIDRGARFEGLS